jgi:uncharacterized Zn-finger protein
MIPFETIEIDEMVAACAGGPGGNGPLGHPRVYLNLAPMGRVECPYCSRLFINRAVAGSGEGATGEGATGVAAPPQAGEPKGGAHG